MNLAILAVSVTSLVVSTATLVVVVVGGKKVEKQVENVREKSNKTLDKIKSALADLEI